MSNTTDVRPFSNQTIAAPNYPADEEEGAIGGIEVIKLGCDMCDKIFGPNGICLLTIGIIGFVVGSTMFGFGTP